MKKLPPSPCVISRPSETGEMIVVQTVDVLPEQKIDTDDSFYQESMRNAELGGFGRRFDY